MVGRNPDDIWKKYKKIKAGKGFKAKCLKCGRESQGLVARMKLHYEKCITGIEDDGDDSIIMQIDSVPPSEVVPDSGSSSEPRPSTSTSHAQETNQSASLLKPNAKKLQSQPTKINNFLVKTTGNEKIKLDQSISEMIYATNSPFRAVEHPKFVKMCEDLRPGYKPPSAYQVGNKYLQAAFEKEKKKCDEQLSGKTVCAALDGWSNVTNDPIICVTITTAGVTHLVDTIDTSGNEHNSEYLVNLATTSIEKIEKESKCTVGCNK